MILSLCCVCTRNLAQCARFSAIALQRFAEERREGRKKRLFSSAFLRALCVSALILLSPIPHLSRQMAHVPSMLAGGSMQAEAAAAPGVRCQIGRASCRERGYPSGVAGC